MIKRIAAGVLTVAAALLLGGCGESRTYANGEVYVYNWGEYINEDVIEMFEDEYDIKVIYDEFMENEDMYPMVKTGAVNYDVVCPSDYMISKMIQEDMLAELNYDNIPNVVNIDAQYFASAEGFDPGNKYAVPYCWGTVGILYNKTMVDEPITSWESLFDEKYKGEILMIESVRDGIGIALKYLGYSVNSTNETELLEAQKLLIEQYPLVQAYVVDEVRNKMIGEEAALGVIYSGEAIYTQRENENLVYVVPEEGSNTWLDCWVIPKNAQNKENAEKWIDFMCRADIALMNFDEITYSTPNKAAKELIEDEEIRNSEIAFPGEEVLNRCEVYTYPGEEMEEVTIKLWNEMKKKGSEQ